MRPWCAPASASHDTRWHATRLVRDKSRESGPEFGSVRRSVVAIGKLSPVSIQQVTEAGGVSAMGVAAAAAAAAARKGICKISFGR